MATCKDCFCQYMCHEFSVYGMGENDITGEYFEDMERRCKSFKDKSKIIELPCKVGDMVYALWDIPSDKKYIVYFAEVKRIYISKRNCRLTVTFVIEPINFRGRLKEYRLDDFGKTVFLTKEEAEKALKELENG